MKTFVVGDRVKYKREFLRSISCFTGSLPFARGTIIALKGDGKNWMIATIRWDAGRDVDPSEVPEKVNAANLAGERALEIER